MEGPQKNRHKQAQCTRCRKVMRSDNLKKHLKMHQEKNIDQPTASTEPTEITCTTSIPIKVQALTFTMEEEKKEMMQDQQLYEENVKRGEMVSNVFSAGGISETSLSKERRYCLDLYRKHCGLLTVKDVVLREWQSKLMNLLEVPSEREIIWIVGAKGNEGKTFIQSYIVSLYEYEKVALLDLDGRSQDIHHALSNRPLEATTIFLFNISKDCHDNESSYRVLETIKDGRALTKKYHTKMLHFKTPNVLIVFSNHPPNNNRLCQDRWNIFGITTGGELKAVTLDRIARKKQTGILYIKKQ